jgi:hypothetical protein
MRRAWAPQGVRLLACWPVIARLHLPWRVRDFTVFTVSTVCTLSANPQCPQLPKCPQWPYARSPTKRHPKQHLRKKRADEAYRSNSKKPRYKQAVAQQNTFKLCKMRTPFRVVAFLSHHRQFQTQNSAHCAWPTRAGGPKIIRKLGGMAKFLRFKSPHTGKPHVAPTFPPLELRRLLPDS